MPLKKPPSVKRSKIQSAKWDELTKDREFQESDIPTLSLLCSWHEVIDRCNEDLYFEGEGMRVAYATALDEIKELPQIGTMKKASAEIRSLNKQLGINDEVKPKQDKKASVISVIATNRKNRSAKAKATG